jgi:hypothetical protein
MNQLHKGKLLLFPLGDLVATPGALSILENCGIIPMRLIARHGQGDWGEISSQDAQANVDALSLGGRLLSSYTLAGDTKIWIITEADRSSTTILLPSEY